MVAWYGFLMQPILPLARFHVIFFVCEPRAVLERHEENARFHINQARRTPYTEQQEKTMKNSQITEML